MSSNKLVSVIIPAYNAADLLPAALDSVLAQTHRPLEIIVVDDGSPDNTAEVMQPYLDKHRSVVRYIRKGNAGVSAARNAGFDKSLGEFVLFMDHDDLIEPAHIHQLHDALSAHAEWGLAYSGARYIDETGTRTLGDIHRPMHGKLLPELVLRQVALPSAGVCLIRRDVFAQVGGFDIEFDSMADIDLWIRIALAGCEFGYVDALSFKYRIRPDSMSSVARKQEQEDFALLEKVYGSATIVPELGPIKQEAYAVAYYENAARYFRTGDPVSGRDRLAKALAGSPKLAEDERWLLTWLSDNANSPRTAEPWQFLQTVMANLPDEAPVLKRLQPVAIANMHITTAFEKYRQCQYREVLPHLWPGVKGNPQILQNKGFLSLSVKSVLWSL